jgi:hypothetical protein
LLLGARPALAGPAPALDATLALRTRSGGSIEGEGLVAMLRARNPVDLRGVAIVGTVDLRPLGTVTEPLRCRECAITGSLIATDVVFERLVDLSGTTITGRMDLRGAIFDDAALLKRVEMPAGAVDGRLARFGGSVSMDHASLAGEVDFTGARFLSDASFAGTDFRARSRFDLSFFADVATFTSTPDGSSSGEGGCDGASGAFHDVASFRRARFGGNVDFGSRCFGGAARFQSAIFGEDGDFALATFEGPGTFDEAAFGGSASFRVSTFRSSASFLGVRSQASIDLNGARFEGGASLFGLSCAGPLTLTSVRLGPEQHIDLTKVSAGHLSIDVGAIDQILGQAVRYRILQRLEAGAREDGDIPLANEARFTLLALQHGERSGIARLFDTGYRTIGGYLVRPSYPLRAFVWLLVMATLLRTLAALWSSRPSRQAAPEDDPPAAVPATTLARTQGRVVVGQRVLATVLQKAAESVSLAFRRNPNVKVEDQDRAWAYFYAAIRWTEFLAYKLLLALFLLGLANSNATARQIVDSIRG